MQGFYGYGSYEAPVWFVGMEEGGGSYDDIRRHIEHWDRRGGEELEDLRSFHIEKGQTEFFEGARSLQSTWRGLVRMLLADSGQDPSPDELRAFQAEQLGRSEGGNCLLELLPLPCRSLKDIDWFYRERSSLPILQRRADYREAVAPWRADWLRKRFQENSPRIVVFYGVDRWYLRWWELIAGTRFHEIPISGHRTHFGRVSNTAFLVTKHPVTPGITSQYFNDIGSLMSQVLRPERDAG